MIVGYARVSSVDQSLDIQIEQLVSAGAEKVFSEKVSGSATTDRIQFHAAMEFVREGDVLIVTRLDRLARSIVDLKLVLEQLEKKGVQFRCLLQPIDTTNSMGRLMMTILGAFAEFELDIRRERQREGIEKAKAKGVYRKTPITAQEIRVLREQGLSIRQIAAKLNTSRADVHRKMPSDLRIAERPPLLAQAPQPAPPEPAPIPEEASPPQSPAPTPAIRTWAHLLGRARTSHPGTP